MKQTLRRCSRCVMPSSWAGISFREDGVCSLCQAAEQVQKIDWKQRQKELQSILGQYKNYASVHSNKYNCLVGYSGGKDSAYTLWAAKVKYGMTPLAVTWDHGIPMSEESEYNLQRVPQLLNVDHLRFTIGRGLRNAMCKHTSKIAGDWCYFCHLGVGAFPARMSKMFDIPLQIWGEPTALYQTTGDYKLEDMEQQDKQHFEKTFSGGMSSEQACPEGYRAVDLQPMTWPTGEFPLQAIYLGNYELWDQREHVDTIMAEVGWKPIPSRISYVSWDKCDCVEGEELRDVQKFHRRRLSRVAFQASKDIRDGILTREAGMRLVEEYEKKLQDLDVGWVLDELGFTSKEELLGMTKEI